MLPTIDAPIHKHACERPVSGRLFVGRDRLMKDGTLRPARREEQKWGLSTSVKKRKLPTTSLHDRHSECFQSRFGTWRSVARYPDPETGLGLGQAARQPLSPLGP